MACSACSRSCKEFQPCFPLSWFVFGFAARGRRYGRCEITHDFAATNAPESQHGISRSNLRRGSKSSGTREENRRLNQNRAGHNKSRTHRLFRKSSWRPNARDLIAKCPGRLSQGTFFVVAFRRNLVKWPNRRTNSAVAVTAIHHRGQHIDVANKPG
jgi:hypothetical protein